MNTELMFSSKSAEWSTRFWNNTDRTTDCWLWQGATDRDGYGITHVPGQGTVRAHRVAYHLTHGDIAAGHHVCHRCDVPACVRPEHLFTGTTQDNTRDRNAKQRQARGSDYPHTLLTETLVREARQLNQEGASVRRLATCYGVSFATMREALRGITWAWVT